VRVALTRVTPADARAWRRALAGEPLAPKTQAERLWNLKAFFRWLERHSRILVDPFAEIEVTEPRKALPVYLSEAEVNTLLDRTPTAEPTALRDRAVLETLYGSALRVGELVRLDLGDVDLSRGLVNVRHGKGKKDRVVPMGRIAARLTARYIQTARLAAPSGAHALFLNDYGHRITGDAIRKAILAPALERAGIEKHVTPHVLRHSCAVHLLENGASVREVQVLLGHAKINTTQLYLAVVPLALQAVHRATHPAEHAPTPESANPTKCIPQHNFKKPRPVDVSEPEEE